VKVKASANRETGRRKERKKRDEGRKEFARWRNASKKRWKEKWLSFIVKKKNNEPLFSSQKTRFGIMAGIVIAIGDRDDDDSREIKMGTLLRVCRCLRMTKAMRIVSRYERNGRHSVTAARDSRQK